MDRRFTNIQIQASTIFANEFKDAFEQSGANSKGEFLSMLLNCWLDPEQQSPTPTQAQTPEPNLEADKCQRKMEDLQNEIELMQDEANGASREIEALNKAATQLQTELEAVQRQAKLEAAQKQAEIVAMHKELSTAKIELEVCRLTHEQQTARQNTEPTEYENILEPMFAALKGRPLKFGPDKLTINSKTQLLQMIVKSFKIKN